MYLSIDEYIESLQKLREKSPLGGNTAICLCLPFIEYLPVEHPVLNTDGDGAVILIKSEKAEEYVSLLSGEKIVKPKLDPAKYPDTIECLKPGSRYEGPCKGIANKTKGLFGPGFHPERGPWYGCAACGCLAQYQDFMEHRR